MYSAKQMRQLTRASQCKLWMDQIEQSALRGSSHARIWPKSTDCALFEHFLGKLEEAGYEIKRENGNPSAFVRWTEASTTTPDDTV